MIVAKPGPPSHIRDPYIKRMLFDCIFKKTANLGNYRII